MSERVVSRGAEEQALVDFLDAAPEQPRALVVEGDAGIGKTTLWLDAVARARDRGFRVLTSRAAAAESVLAYTGLADLFGDVEESIRSDLPGPQRQGLDAALLCGRDHAPDTDARAVAAAVVAVIERLAAQGPLLVAIDDLQWLDTSTANAVSFAARRIPRGAALLCTTRTGQVAWRVQLPNPDAVHRIRVRPLTVGELQQVLMIRLGVSFARPMLLRIHEIAGGNPFFALEPAREVGTKRVSQLSLPSSLSELVDSRISRVGVGAEDPLLAAACLPDPTVEMVAQASDTTPNRLIELLSEAEEQAVVTIDGHRIQFTHPVLAHGVYTGATPRRRRDMHRRLADLVTEPELRARHLALSAAIAEPQIVEALDAAADIARARGAPAAAAELIELAIGLGADEPSRRIRCAAYHFNAGNGVQARTLLERTLEQPAQPERRAEARRLLGLWSLLDGSSQDATHLLESALADAGDDLALRAQILVPLAFAQLNVHQLDNAARCVQAAVRSAMRCGQSPLLSQALSMRVLIHFLLGRGVDKHDLRHALELEDARAPISALLRASVQNAQLLVGTGQLEQARRELRAIRQRYIERGEESELMIVAFHGGLSEIWLGDFADAALIAEDAMERALLLEGDLPRSVALMLRALVAAYAGQELDARADASEALAICQRCDSPQLVTVWPITTLGFLEVSLGNYQAAIAALEPLLANILTTPEATEIFVAPFVPDAAEALIGVGRLEEAEGLIEALESNGRRLDRPWMLALGMRCRAMLLAGRGEVKAATSTAELAMAQHDRLPMPFERARTQLLLGQLQRRQRHREAATATLGEALQTFERLGTTLWAGRAKGELARGMSGRRRAEGLTPSEQRVAELAVTGMTNRDIASALFISPKTVEVNLSRIYHKLNIHSRVELYRALNSLRTAPSPENFR
jgi:DNA-binding CsgD family transcriptional regulator